MKTPKITLGYVPTRRSIFSAPDALKYRGLICSSVYSFSFLMVSYT